METFHLYHLAACWKGRTLTTKAASTPLTTGPVSPTITQTTSPTHLVHPAPLTSPNSVIRAAATHLVFASRKSRDFITPQQVAEVEKWTGQVRFSSRCPRPSRLCLIIFVAFLQGVLNALVNLAIPQDVSISSPDPRFLMTFSSECTQSTTLFGKSYRNLIGAIPNQISISVAHLCLLKSQCFPGFCPFNHSLEHDRVVKSHCFWCLVLNPHNEPSV